MKLKLISTISMAALVFSLQGGFVPEDAHAMGKKKQRELQERLDEAQEKLDEAEEELAESKQKLAENKEEEERKRLEDVENQRKQDEALRRLRELAGKVPGTDMQWDRHRCKTYNDSLSQAQAHGRYSWTVKCLHEKAESYLSVEDDVVAAAEGAYYGLLLKALEEHRTWNGARNTKVYPTFGVFVGEGSKMEITNPLNYQAPIDPNADCNIPEGYTVTAVCESSCYTPDQLILFESGYEEIAKGKAFDLRAIIALDKSSTVERPVLRTSELTHYITSLVEGQHEVVDILTESGKELTVTTDHPMVKAGGVMVTASSLEKGDLLLSPEGQPDPIVRLSGRTYFGKVYNVRLATDDPIENIVVANGLLTGTSFYQNEGISNLNRRLFRVNLPDELIEGFESEASK